MIPTPHDMAIVRAIARRVYRRCGPWAGHILDQADLEQAAYVRLLGITVDPGRTDQERNAYVIRHARGAVTQALRDAFPNIPRKGHQWTRIDRDEMPAVAPHHDDTPEAITAAHRGLEAGLSRLSANQANVLKAHDYEGHKLTQIARQSGRTVARISQLHTAAVAVVTQEIAA